MIEKLLIGLLDDGSFLLITEDSRWHLLEVHHQRVKLVGLIRI